MVDVNWNAELRKIEREFSGLPKEPSPAELNARRASERLAKHRQEAMNAAVGASTRVSLFGILATALTFWPYSSACGWGLYGYIAAVTVMLACAVWVVTYTWRFHMAKTHGLALMLALGTLSLLAVQVLPRIGYAKPDAAHPAHWSCSAPAAASAPAAP
jgi:hypothetical protein